MSASVSTSVKRAAPLVLPAIGRHTATVIFIHGLGDTGVGWEDAAQMWKKSEHFNEIKFILPHAPMIPISMNNGFKMPGWFDIKTIEKGADEDIPGILQSRDYFNSLIRAEMDNGIPSDRIVIGGFSQGGAMSIVTGLTSPVKLGGVVGLSSWLLLNKTFKEHVPGDNINRDTPVFMGHGDMDPLVRYNLAKESEEMLKGWGYNVTFKTYPQMQHSACLSELQDVQQFLAQRLPSKSDLS